MRNPFREAINKAIKVDAVKLVDDPFYGWKMRVSFFVNGVMKCGAVNNCGGDMDCLVYGDDGNWYAGKQENFKLIK